MNKDIRRGILIPVIAIIAMGINLASFMNEGCIRAIHIVTLLVMGFALGMLVMNLITFYKNKRNV